MEVHLSRRLNSFQKVIPKIPTTEGDTTLLYHVGFVVFSFILYSGLILLGYVIHQYIFTLLGCFSIVLMIGLIAAYGANHEDKFSTHSVNFFWLLGKWIGLFN